MALRITDGALARTVLRDLDNAEARINRSREQLTSGKQISRPSDDPYGTARAISLRNELEASRQYRRTIDEAQAWVDASDATLGSVGDVVLRARDLLVQGANSATGPTGRAAIAAELDQLAEAVKTHANATYDGRHLLSGTAVDTRPYEAGSDVYRGGTNAIYREIGPGVSVQVSATADSVLGGATGLLATLRSAAAHLRSTDPADQDLVRTDLRNLDVAHTTLLSARGTLGATSARLQAAGERQEMFSETAARALSEVEDTDFAKAIITLNSQQAAYQAALKAGASLIPPTLLDFLR